MLDELTQTENRVVGLKQLLRELEADRVVRVYIAEDADAPLKEKILQAIGGKDVDVVSVSSMEELGKVCGIDVGAACAGLLQ